MNWMLKFVDTPMNPIDRTGHPCLSHNKSIQTMSRALKLMPLWVQSTRLKPLQQSKPEEALQAYWVSSFWNILKSYLLLYAFPWFGIFLGVSALCWGSLYPTQLNRHAKKLPCSHSRQSQWRSSRPTSVKGMHMPFFRWHFYPPSYK